MSSIISSLSSHGWHGKKAGRKKPVSVIVDDDEMSYGSSEHSVEVHSLLLGSSTRSHTSTRHESNHGPASEPVPVPTSPVRPIVANKFDATNLEVVPKLLLTDIWSEDASVVLHALEIIGELCRCVDDDNPNQVRDAITNRKLVRQVGGHLALVLVMRKWRHSSVIQAEGCFVLGSAAMDNDFTSAAVEVGAIDAVLGAMRLHPHEEVVQLYGCGALLVISLESLATAKHLVLELKALDTLTAALYNFPNSSDIEDLTCQIFLSLSEYPQMKGPLIKAGAIRAIGSVFERYATEENGGFCDSKSVEEMAKETIERLLDL